MLCESPKAVCGMDASSILLNELFTHPFTLAFSEKARLEALNLVEKNVQGAGGRDCLATLCEIYHLMVS